MVFLQADIWSLGVTAIELAKGEPPNADMHPMRVLFLIPKNKPPQLEGQFSRPFKEFVSSCLNKDPEHVSVCKTISGSLVYVMVHFSFFQRPTAQELLHHRFLKIARKPSSLTELIEKYLRWHQEEGQDEDMNNDITE